MFHISAPLALQSALIALSVGCDDGLQSALLTVSVTLCLFGVDDVGIALHSQDLTDGRPLSALGFLANFLLLGSHLPFPVVIVTGTMSLALMAGSVNSATGKSQLALAVAVSYVIGQ